MAEKIMSKDDLQKILQIGTVDVGNDTLFSRVNKLKVNKDRLTLVISSGGSGASAIKEAIATAKQKLEGDFAVYMKFIMVDSATEEINAASEALGRNQLQILNISTDGASQRLIQANRDDFYKQFVPLDYDNTKLNGDGSGRDRMTGRIKFYDNAAGGNYNDVKFRNMIASLYSESGDWNAHKDKPVDIMILAGLSGGNGSGTFQDLAAHARYACEQQSNAEVRVFGYLFLPDTVEEFEKNNPAALSSLYCNGYAALKELESHMCIPFNPERSAGFLSRDVGVTGIAANSNKPLFNYPVLISGGYNESKSMMAESIINLAVASDGTFNQNSFYSNSVVAREAHLGSNACLNGGLLKSDEFPEDSRRYAGIGYAYAAIPNEIVTANVVSNVCKKLYEDDNTVEGTKSRFCTENSRMSRFEMESQIRRLFSFGEKEKLTVNSFWEQKINGTLKKVSTLTKNENDITKQEIKAGKVDAYEKGFHAEERVIQGTREFEQHLESLYKIFEQNATLVIKDYGPRAIEYLFSGKGPDDKDGKPQYYTDISIDGMLKEAENRMNKILGESKARPNNDIPNGLIEAVLKTKITDWKLAFHNTVEYETKQEIVKNATGMMGAWQKKIIDPIKNFVRRCQYFADRLEMLSDYYFSAGSPLDDQSYARFLAASQEGNCVNLCNSADVYEWVKSQVTRKINSVNTATVKQGLVDSFINYPDEWMSNAEGKTRKEFDRVMSASCGLGRAAGTGVQISLTATSYFEYVLSQVEDSEVTKTAEALVSSIVKNLLTKSKPSLKKNGGYCAENKFVMIPESLRQSKYGTAIESAFEAMVKAEGEGTAQVVVSGSVNDVVCYQTSVANALYDMTDLPKWETYYNEATSTSRHINNGQFGGSYIEKTKTQVEQEKAVKNGIPAPTLYLTEEEDIVFGTGLSWEHYPPLALRNLKENKKESAFLKQIFNPIVDFALKERIIERKSPAGSSPDVYQYVINLIPESWDSLDVSDYREMGTDGRLKRGETLFAYLSSQNVLSNDTWQKPIRLNGSGFFDNPYDFSSARTSGTGMVAEKIQDYGLQYMKRILRRNTQLFLELRETLCRYFDVSRELKEKDGLYWHDYVTGLFADYYSFGVIIEDQGKWYYRKDARDNRQAFCSFSLKETTAYNDFEKKLYKDDWKFLLALRKFTELDMDKLEAVKQDLLNDMEEDDLQNIIQRNEVALGEMKNRIVTDILNKYPNRVVEDAVRKVFNLDKEADSFYIKSIESALEKWPDGNGTVPVSTPKPVIGCAPKPESGWTCPKCGRHNEDDFAICPVCMTKQPVPEPEVSQQGSGWNCPKCGRHNEENFAICPVCMTAKPVEESGWNCPKCGRHNEDDFAICPICMTPRTEVKKESGWNCPKCGRHNEDDFAICPVCMTTRP